MVVSRPSCFVKVGFSIFLCSRISGIHIVHRALSFILCISTCFWVFACKTCFLGIQVELGNNICICVKVCLFLLFWTIIGGSKYAIVTANNWPGA
jgi:hypothetical protein